MLHKILVFVLLLNGFTALLALRCDFAAEGSGTLRDAALAPSLCAFTLPVYARGARGLLALGYDELRGAAVPAAASLSAFVGVARGAGALMLYVDRSGRGDFSNYTLAMAGLNHGVAVSFAQRALYASSTTQVFQFAFSSVEALLSGNALTPQVVVHNMPAGGHFTRSLKVITDEKCVLCLFGKKKTKTIFF